MSTEIDAPIVVDESKVLGAAMAVAEAFGLGEEFKASRSWPIDDGDRVLRVEYDGEHRGAMLLAVNADVAERLGSDELRLAGGFQSALTALMDSESTVELGAFESVDSVPEYIVEILDEGRRCALFGIMLTTDEVVDEGDPAALAAEALLASQADAESRAATARALAGGSSLLDDVDVSVSVELGRTTMSVRELLAVQPGSVIRLDRLVTAPVDVIVNDSKLTAGHVVTVGDDYGVLIAEPDAG
ncbi:MAG: FliM/FliN family flagellar motor switch protein [Ilumatobacter sp.]